MQRGFVMVMLLAIVAVLTVVLSVLLISNKQSAVIAVRESEEMKARNVAELCLSKGIAVAVEHFRQRGGDDFDFDGLLDPDGVSGNTDDHVFANVTAANTRLYVPTEAEGTPTEALFRYSFERFEPDGSGPLPPGGCYLRFDDNADDNLPGYAAQTGNTGGVAEGTGINVNNRDRDASIVVTAIGIYPALTSTLDVDAYTKAHARVTLKQYFSATAAPAIYGNGDIHVAGNSEFCGSGGLRGVDVEVAPTSCVCGDGLARSINGDTSASTVDDCGAARCPRAALGSSNDIGAIPAGATFATDFPEQCLIYSETLGENPSTFRLEDTVVTGASRDPRGNGGGNGMRLRLRDDGAVFMWDSRALTSALDNDISNRRCDGFPEPVWPPADATDTPANNTAKHSDCSTALGAGYYCGITSATDIEFCRRDAVNTPGDPAAIPPVLPVSIAEDITTVRCDRLRISGSYVPASPIEGNTTAKNSRCAGADAPNSTCIVTPDLFDIENCLPPSSLLNCNSTNPNTIEPLDPTQWADVTTNITALEDGVCFSSGRRKDGSTCTVGTGPVADSRRLCWRMVAKLGDAKKNDPGGVAEWDDGAGHLVIPAGSTNAHRVPNVRGDTKFAPSNLTTTTFAMVNNVMGSTGAGGNQTIVANARTLKFNPGAGWETVTGWRNENSQKRLPTPSYVFVNATPAAVDLAIADDSRIGGVTWFVDGNVVVGGGTVNLAAAGFTGPSQVNYTGGAAECSIEKQTVFTTATANSAMTQQVLVVSGTIDVQANRFLALGRVLGGGGLRVRTPVDGACLVGGISMAGFAPGGCSVSACDAPGVCFEGRVGVVGSIFADQDLSAPQGLFAQRGNGGMKISQLMSRQDVCVLGSSRIAGQIVSEKAGGLIDVGPDLLMVQSGEVGYGFATKRTTWTDSSW